MLRNIQCLLSVFNTFLNEMKRFNTKLQILAGASTEFKPVVEKAHLIRKNQSAKRRWWKIW